MVEGLSEAEIIKNAVFELICNHRMEFDTILANMGSETALSTPDFQDHLTSVLLASKKKAEKKHGKEST